MDKEPKNKANDVTDLTITKVDFVDAGANQRANIALLKHQPPKGGEGHMEKENPVKKAFLALAKALGIADEPPADAQKVAKEGAQTFDEQMQVADMHEVFDEMYDMMDALRASWFSIMKDEAVADKGTMLKQSIDQFSAAAKNCADVWGGGKLAAVKKIDSRPMDGIEADVAKAHAEAVLKACAASGGGKKTEKEEPVPDDMNPDGTPKPKTSHSLAVVPFAIYNGPEGTKVKEEGDFGLANVAATVVKLLGLEAPEQWLESIIE